MGSDEQDQGGRPFSLSLHRLAGYDYANPDHAVFVTSCAARGTAPFVDAPLAGAVISSLTWLRTHREVALYAYCLMPDHLHLLLRLPDGHRTLGEIMHSLKSFTARPSVTRAGRGKLWQDRYYDHRVRRSEDGLRIAEYMLQNPVRKGLVTDSASYPWSGTPDPL